MNAEQNRAKSIFLNAAEIAARADQEAYLTAQCGDDEGLRREVVDLLAHHAPARAFLEAPALKLPATMDDPVTERPGAVIGPFKLLQQIGEGGMGTVFMAEQTHPVQRKVALKIIKPGMDSRQVIARFEAERQALAMMDHVNIARVLDAGATEAGRPYFVMELVHGVPITKYCDDNQLSPRERLELFVPVCQAIQHAHQKGIIHRDIKPSNVMITLYDGKPVPKVIDFGLAKATEQKLTERTLFTQYGTLVGTLEYMSPEQAESSALGVDTRSDIYSLGVLLYELLTGSTPLSRKRVKEAAYAELLRMIKEEEPPKPSTRLSDSGEALASISAQRHMEPAKLTKLVRGELDWIVMKTLEKDRNRRYEAANGLAMDVQRYLNDEAVQACPPSAGYRLRKLVRRNKGPVAVASLVALALVVAIIGTTWGMIRATDAEASAVHEAKQKELALNDKIKALAAAETSEQNARSKEALAKAAQQEAVESLQEALKAVDQMLTRVAEKRLAHSPHMEQLERDVLRDAVQFYQGFLQKRSGDPAIRRETGKAYGRVANVYRYLGQNAEAEDAFAKAIDMLEQLAAEFPHEADPRAALVLHHTQFSWLLASTDRPKEAEKAQRRAVALAEELVEGFPDVPGHQEQLARAYVGLASYLSNRDEAEKLLRRGIGLAEKSGNELRRAQGLVQLADLLAGSGREKEAEVAYRQALALYAKSPYPENRGNTLNQLGWFLERTGRPQEAEKFYTQAVATFGQLVTDSPTVPYFRGALANCHYNLGKLLKSVGRFEEAEKSYRRVMDLYEKLTVDFPTVSGYQQAAFNHRLRLGQLLTAAGRAHDAQEVYRPAIELPDKLSADVPTKLNHWQGLVRTHIELGRLLAAAGKTQQAEAAYGQVVAIQEKLEASLGGKPEFRRELIQSHLHAANLLKDARQMEGVEKLYRLAQDHYAGLEKALGDALASDQVLARDHPTERKYQTQLARAQTKLAFCCRDRGGASRWSHDWATAQEHYDRYLKLCEEAAKTEPNSRYKSNLAWAYRDLGDLHLEWEKPAAAQDYYRKQLELRQAIAEADPNHSEGKGLIGRAYVYMGRASLELGEAAAQECFRNAGDHCNLAWSLATCPDPKARDAGQAIELAKKVSELAPKDGNAWKTLGAAHYRAGDWQAAIEALQKANQLKAGGDAYEWFYLAMAHWQRGDKEQARKWYDQAIHWIEKNNPRPGFVFGDKGGEQLRRLRTEAAALLGVKDQPTPPGNADLPKKE